jgi:hypothetical protein
MPKSIAATADSQIGTQRFPNGEIIPRPVLNTPASAGVWNASKPIPRILPPKKKFTVLDQDDKIVATLIDRGLAEKWVADRKKGAARFVEDSRSPFI